MAYPNVKCDGIKEVDYEELAKDYAQTYKQRIIPFRGFAGNFISDGEKVPKFELNKQCGRTPGLKIFTFFFQFSKNFKNKILRSRWRTPQGSCYRSTIVLWPWPCSWSPLGYGCHYERHYLKMIKKK